MTSNTARHVAGTLTVVCIAAIVAVAVGLFNGSFTRSATVTVVSDRVGLVMNPDAKVKLHGAQVGKVAAIEARPDGRAEIHLAMEPSALQIIPANVLVNIGSTTVFGSKAVELVPPADPRPNPCGPGRCSTPGT